MPSAFTSKPPRKKIHLNFFETACTGNHECAGQWSAPGDNSRTKDRLKYYIDLAKLAEKHKITCIFFADSYADTRSMPGTWTLCSGLERRLRNLIRSTSYIPPFPLARTFSTLDHLTNGWIAWNVVTSWSKAAANAFGRDLEGHDKRYEIAEEYMDVVYKLWNGSWADDSVRWDEVNRVAYEPSRIKKIEHNGTHLRLSARHQLHPSPQRTPVLFQAGTSKSGMAFAARHAEAIYIGGMIPSQATAQIKVHLSSNSSIRRPRPHNNEVLRRHLALHGRTMEEAQAKFDRAAQHADIVGGLAQFSGYTNIDMSKYPLDEELKLDTSNPAENVIHGFLGNYIDSIDTEKEPWTPRRLGMKMALGGLHPSPVGTPEMIADIIEQWIDEADIDGFNIAYVSNPGSFEDVVNLLRPVLLERGLIFEDYAVPGGTFRENLLRQARPASSEERPLWKQVQVRGRRRRVDEEG
ncbi:bacterial luciferase-like protein [Hyaloscypha variabilis F]|uniref:Bacterial luciferase-like protein n=1 Tax=Hyaloscypha variabilis (strain UAMH 11265 / GT02V1 / F) TaxID=1149755 RepID=A0A2J6QWL8_HYAVF|nr:bacterial luciferase-like protein [Hyaloscypha variabilis F]